VIYKESVVFKYFQFEICKERELLALRQVGFKANFDAISEI